MEDVKRRFEKRKDGKYQFVTVGDDFERTEVISKETAKKIHAKT